jgi:CHAT domain-containing protein
LKHERLTLLQSAVHTRSRKRLWWCPIGPLVSLPLHAAGVYDGPSQDCIGNYALSSYTPTITALHRLLKDIPVEGSFLTTPKVLLVSQPTSVGLPSLVNADVEINQIKTLIPPELTVNEDDGSGVSIDDALNGLRNGAHVLHLACHGHQDQDNPLNSGFELKDGRLTVRQLMHLSIPHAQLAYLSACDSAGIDESRPDEGLNLVGTMIFVGFRSVIGTMW